MKKNQEKNDITNKYEPKKKQNLKFANYIKPFVSDKMLDLILNCSTFMEFLVNEAKDKMKLHKINGCKNRFCPLCAYREAHNTALLLMTLMHAMIEEKNYEFLFLTLTVPNVKGNELSHALDEMNKGVKRLFQRKQVKMAIEGYVRKLEITRDNDQTISKRRYNKNKNYYQKRNIQVGDVNPNYDTYHPHMHFLIAVKKSYFKKNYLSQQELLKLWRQSMRMTGVNEDGTDEIVALDVRKVNLNKPRKAIQEVSKYTAKDSDMLVSQEVFEVFYKSLKGRQLIVYNGVFKEYVKRYKAGELEDYKEKDDVKYVYLLLACWNPEYLKYEQELQPLTKEKLEAIELEKKHKKEKVLINQLEAEKERKEFRNDMNKISKMSLEEKNKLKY